MKLYLTPATTVTISTAKNKRVLISPTTDAASEGYLPLISTIIAPTTKQININKRM
jgi:hypothetical protein